MRILVMTLIMMSELFAMNQNMIVGKWQATTQVNHKGTVTIEKEYLNLNADHTFSILLLVSIQKGDAFVKDLQIKGYGLWKMHHNILVYVIRKVDVPFAKEVYRISQESLRQLANHFKHRFDDQPIRINTITGINARQLNIMNENQIETHYAR